MVIYENVVKCQKGVLSPCYIMMSMAVEACMFLYLALKIMARVETGEKQVPV
jgi:hypothetical protein